MILQKKNHSQPLCLTTLKNSQVFSVLAKLRVRVPETVEVDNPSGLAAR